MCCAKYPLLYWYLQTHNLWYWTFLFVTVACHKSICLVRDRQILIVVQVVQKHRAEIWHQAFLVNNNTPPVRLAHYSPEFPLSDFWPFHNLKITNVSHIFRMWKYLVKMECSDLEIILTSFHIFWIHSFPWLFDEHSHRHHVSAFGDPNERNSLPHVWIVSTTFWSDFCQWHIRQRRAESSGWFELDYQKVFGKTWYNTSAPCICSSCMKTKIRRLHTIRLYSRSNSLQLARPTREKNITYQQKVWTYVTPKWLWPWRISFGIKI